MEKMPHAQGAVLYVTHSAYFKDILQLCDKHGVELEWHSAACRLREGELGLG